MSRESYRGFSFEIVYIYTKPMTPVCKGKQRGENNQNRESDHSQLEVICFSGARTKLLNLP